MQIYELSGLASEQGDIGGVDVDATAAAMLAYVEGVLLMAKAQNDPDVLARLLPAMLDIRIPAPIQRPPFFGKRVNRPVYSKLKTTGEKR